MRAELRLIHPISPRSIPPWLPPPEHDVFAGFKDLAAHGMRITLKTPTYEWPQFPWDDVDRESKQFKLDWIFEHSNGVWGHYPSQEIFGIQELKSEGAEAISKIDLKVQNEPQGNMKLGNDSTYLSGLSQ
ncbi:hypothetical protein B0H13DRAFT_1862273 [Mycena leptocephala]|nr:hypothetical protein B0H13DRAFT_1862273 [Mycena leptocephala]